MHWYCSWRIDNRLGVFHKLDIVLVMRKLANLVKAVLKGSKNVVLAAKDLFL